MRCAALLLGAGIGVFATNAAGSESYYVYADVVGVEPQIERHTVARPLESCSVTRYPTQSAFGDPNGERDYYRDHRRSRPSGAATIIGGMIGGLLGSQFGAGHGRKALTVAGAMVGASIAGVASQRRRERNGGYYADSGYAPRHCSTVMESREVEEITGYRVRYRYQGQEFEKWTDKAPGNHVRIRVQVNPVGGGPEA